MPDGALQIIYTPASQPGEITIVSTEDREASEAARDSAELARDDAQSARDEAVAAADLFTAPADDVVASMVAGPGPTRTALDAGYVGLDGIVNPYVEGVPLYSYGHSYTMYPSPYTSPLTGEYMERVRTRLKMGKGYFRGRSETPLQDTLGGFMGSLIGPSGSSDDRKWVLGSRGVVLFENYMNESSAIDGTYAKYREGWGNALRTFMRLINSTTFIPATSATKSGTWTALAPAPILNRWRDSVLLFASTVGNSLTFTVPSGDSAYLCHAISDAGYNTGVIKVTCNGVTVATIAEQDRIRAYTSAVDGIAVNYNPHLTEVTGLNAAAGTSGSKTIVVSVTEAKNTFIGGVFLPGSTPPHVFYAKEPQRNPAATNQSGVTYFNANRAAFEAMVDTVAAEFPNLHSLELDPGWDNSTMVASLDTSNHFHPNDLGMEHIAGKFVDAINATITQPIAGVLTL